MQAELALNSTRFSATVINHKHWYHPLLLFNIFLKWELRTEITHFCHT